MKQFFKELFDYSNNANQKIFEVLNKAKALDCQKSISLFSHLLNAQHIWNNRIGGRPVAYAVWDLHSINQCELINKDNYKQSLHILDNVDLDEIIGYKITSGAAFQNSVSDILFHVINHSTYHRAQIVSDLKQNGIEPINTDYILFKR
ncbi:MAG TPA: DinB family protein [Pelobium sp.]